MNTPETYYVTCQGVTIICQNKQSVLSWIEFCLEKGIVPNIERVRSYEVAA